MRDIKPKIGNNPPQKGQLAKDELGVDVRNAKLYIGLANGNPLLISGGGEGTTWNNTQPTTAQDVDGIPSGTIIPIGLDPISIIEYMLYPQYGVAFTGLNTRLLTNYELGQTALNTFANITWSRTSGNEDKWVDNSCRFDYSGLASGNLFTNVDPRNDFAQVTYPSTFRGTSLTNNALTLTLKAKQEVSEVISDVSISSTSFWWSKIFWGKSTNPNITDPSQLNFLQSLLITNKSTTNQEVSIPYPPGEGFAYFFIHNNYEMVRMTFQGFGVLLEPVLLRTININGIPISYKMYRTQELVNGSLNFLVTYKFIA